MLLERKRDGNFEKNRKSGSWCKVIRTKKLSEELIDMLGKEESLDRMVKASSMRWYGHVLRKEDENVIVKSLKFEVRGRRGRPK